MIKNEWLLIARELKAAYSNKDFMNDEYTVKLWFEALKDLDGAAVKAAVDKYILTEHYAPAIADIRKIASDMQTAPIQEWSAAFEQVRELIRKYGYSREAEALEEMPEPTRETVKRIGWFSLCMSENQTADRAAFRDIYSQIATDARNNARLPDALKQAAPVVTGDNRRFIDQA